MHALPITLRMSGGASHVIGFTATLTDFADSVQLAPEGSALRCRSPPSGWDGEPKPPRSIGALPRSRELAMSACIYVMRVLPFAPRRSEERISFKTTESAAALQEHMIALQARWGSTAVRGYIRKAPLAATHTMASMAILGWKRNALRPDSPLLLQPLQSADLKPSRDEQRLNRPRRAHRPCPRRAARASTL